MDFPKTIPEMFFNQVDKWHDREELKYKLNGVWKSVTWNQFGENVMNFAKALTKYIKSGEMVCIFSDNCPEWAYTDLAILSTGGINVPLYPTSPVSDIKFIINDCKAKMIFAGDDEQIEILKLLLDENSIPSVEKIFVFKQTKIKHNKIEDIDSFLKAGKGVKDSVVNQLIKNLKDSDIATLIYTSGTTGEPKGVILTHKNLISNIQGLVQHQIPVTDSDVAISFLPLSHSFERMVGYYLLLYVGVTIAYTESMEQLVDNMAEVQPTIMVSVPRVYEKLYSGAKENLNTGIKRALFNWALSTGGEYIKYQIEGWEIPEILEYKHKIADKFVFSRLRDMLGGKLKYSVSGGAPLSLEIAEFILSCGLTILEGYGLTETSPVVSANVPGKLKLGTVGKVLPNLEVSIAKDFDSQIDGEILVRGPSITKGYYNKNEETKTLIDKEGWLHTGDIGYVDGEGFLHITGRIKELIKTSGGKYVAPRPIEESLTNDIMVEYAVIIGDRKKYCVALIVPHFDRLAKWADEHTIEFASREELCSHPSVLEYFSNLLEKVNEPLGSWEQIKYFRLLRDEFTTDSGELTPSLKLKRRVISKKYASTIDSMYPDD